MEERERRSKRRRSCPESVQGIRLLIGGIHGWMSELRFVNLFRERKRFDGDVARGWTRRRRRDEAFCWAGRRLFHCSRGVRLDVCLYFITWCVCLHLNPSSTHSFSSHRGLETGAFVLCEWAFCCSRGGGRERGRGWKYKINIRSVTQSDAQRKAAGRQGRMRRKD